MKEYELYKEIDPNNLKSLKEWEESFTAKNLAATLGFRKSQIGFVLNKLNWYIEGRPTIYVISNYMINSVLFPVYYLKIGNTEIVMKNNIKFWTISVKSKTTLSFLSIFYFEPLPEAWEPFNLDGMEDWSFEPYEKNQKEFTMRIILNEELFAFFKIMQAYST